MIKTEEMIEFWRKKGETPGAITPDSYPENKENDIFTCDCLLEDIPKEQLKTSILLDVGCGEGRLMQYIAPKVKEYIGADISDTVLNRAYELVKTLNFRNVTLINLTFHKDLWTLTEESYFDIVISFTVFMHLPTKMMLDYFKEIFRILKPGGYFRCQINSLPDMGKDDHWFDEVPNNDFWTARWYPQNFLTQWLMDTGFKIEKTPTLKNECWFIRRP